MLKKFLAALTAIALSLGMVALTAGPASAHHNTINAVVSCNTTTDGFWKVTWTVQNSEGIAEKITFSSDTSIVPADTVIAGGATLTVVRYFKVKPAANSTLSLSAEWTNKNTNTSAGTLYAGDFKSNCVPDDTDKKVPVCHATGSANNPYTTPPVSASSIITNDPNGHGAHANDIIPPFTYVKQGVAGSYPGKNWDAYGQAVYAANCDFPTVTPTKPTITQAVCTAAGQVGGAGYTIPATITGVSYEKSATGNNNSWSTVNPGTYPTTDGTSVWIRAVALPGYKVGSPSSWKLDFTDVDPAKCVVPASPTPTYQVCTTPGGTNQAKYVIPASAGIQYELWNGTTWAPVSAGADVNTFPTLIELRASAKPGFTIVGGPYTWNFPFASAGPCLVDATPVEPTFKDAICVPTGPGTTSGYYVVNGTAGDHLIYEVRLNGGSWKVVDVATYGVQVKTSPSDLVEIRVKAASGYTLAGNQQGPWSHTFANPGDCLDDATPVEPTFKDAVCVEPGTGTTSGYYVVNGALHVVYEVRLNGGSWTVVDPATYGTQVKTSPNDVVELRVTAAAGYKLSGNQQGPWSHTFTNPGDCLDDSTPVEPTFKDAICVDPGTGTTSGYYVVNGTVGDHVVYEVRLNGGSWTVVDPGTYGTQVPTSPSDVVEIRVTAASGYKLSGTQQGPWSHTFTNPGACLDPAPVDPIAHTDQTCVVGPDGTGSYVKGSITIPSTLHVTYSIGAVELLPGTYPYGPGTYTVTAKADAGYALTSVPDPWTVKIAFAEACGDLIVHPLVTPAVTFAQTTCKVAGSYTLAVEETGSEAGVVWTVTGGLPNTLGSHSVNTPGTVTITATPAPGYGFAGAVPFREWSFTIAALPDDCLPTLALTGGSIAGGALGLSALLMLGGILLVTARRRGTADMSV